MTRQRGDVSGWFHDASSSTSKIEIRTTPQLVKPDLLGLILHNQLGTAWHGTGRGKAEDLVVPQPEMDELKKGHSIIDRSQQSQGKIVFD